MGESCSSCEYLFYDRRMDEYGCTKLNEYTTLDDYCGYWRLSDEPEEFSEDY